MSRRICVLAVWAGAASLPSEGLGAGANLRGVGDLPGGSVHSTAWGISPDGSVVVGGSTSDLWMEAYRWQAGVMSGLGDLPDGPDNSCALAVSADGAVIVGEGNYYPVIATSEAFRWEDGVMSGLDVLCPGSFAMGVSADGTIVVGAIGSDGLAREAFRWTEAEGMVGLGDSAGQGEQFQCAYAVSADGTVIVGAGRTSSGQEAFRWVNGVASPLGDLGGSSTHSSGATDCSADGSILVGYGRSAQGIEAMRWQDGVMSGLGDLPGGTHFGFAFAVSADGSIVVGESDSASGYRAFIWDATHGMRDLGDALASEYGLDLGGWVLQEATDISDDGMAIVGNGLNPAGDYEGWIVNLGSRLHVDVVNDGWGRVEVEPNLALYPDPNTEVTLTAVPEEDRSLKHWLIFDPNFPGDTNHAFVDDVNNPIVISMMTDREVTAVYKCGLGVHLIIPSLIGITGCGLLLRRMRPRSLASRRDGN